MKFVTLILLILCITISLNAQIPNAGFEDWIDENTPQYWNTNNLPSTWITVSRSANAYSGSYAARIEIPDFNGFPIYPVLTVTFPVTQYDQVLNGYYQFYPVGNEVVLSVYAYYFKDGFLTGSGSIDLDAGVSSYTSFSFDPSAGYSGTPDSLWIQFEMVSNSGTNPGIGSYALIDQLSLGGASDLKQINRNLSDYSLKQNYPNPFNPTTTISFSIPKTSRVTLEIYNSLGEKVSTLVSETLSAGKYNYEWDSEGLASGIYFYKMVADNFTEIRKMILLK